MRWAAEDQGMQLQPSDASSASIVAGGATNQTLAFTAAGARATMRAARDR